MLLFSKIIITCIIYCIEVHNLIDDHFVNIVMSMPIQYMGGQEALAICACVLCLEGGILRLACHRLLVFCCASTVYNVIFVIVTWVQLSFASTSLLT